MHVLKILICCTISANALDLAELVAKTSALDGFPRNASVEQFPGEGCARSCEQDERPRVCYFKFVLEYFHAMGP